MSRGGRGLSVLVVRRKEARFRSRRIQRQTTIHPTDTTINSTQATLSEGSVRNSRNGRCAARNIGFSEVPPSWAES
jgi:hypothetical protein